MNLLNGNIKSDAQSRRAFLKCAGAAAVGVGLPGCATTPRTSTVEKGQPTGRNVRVKVQAPADPLVARTFAILKDRIEQRCAVKVVEAGDRAHLILTMDDRLPREAFRIDQLGGAVRVVGGSPRGLLYDVGKFLRTSRYDGTFLRVVKGLLARDRLE